MSKKSPRSIKKVIDKEIYTGFLYRAIAWIIDIALIYFITWILFIFVFIIFNYFLLHFVAYIIGFFYFTLLETYNKGQTLGKLIFHIKSVNEETMEVETLQGNIVNSLLKCNWITCIFDFTIGIIKNYGDQKKKIRIMQNLSNIVVISSKKKP